MSPLAKHWSVLASGLLLSGTPPVLHQALISAPVFRLVPHPHSSFLGFFTSSDILKMPCSTASGFCTYTFPCLCLSSLISACFFPSLTADFIPICSSSVVIDLLTSDLAHASSKTPLGLNISVYSMRDGCVCSRNYPLLECILLSFSICPCQVK